MKDLRCDPFARFAEDWAVVTAGSIERFNGMTISWGSQGTLWGKPIVTVYVRPDRYTWEFLKENETFTVTFFPEAQRGALRVMGTTSGRDGDKVRAAGLTPVALDGCVTYAEAEQTFVCRKLCMQQFDRAACPEEALRIYQNGVEPHWIIIGELVNTL